MQWRWLTKLWLRKDASTSLSHKATIVSIKWSKPLRNRSIAKMNLISNIAWKLLHFHKNTSAQFSMNFSLEWFVDEQIWLCKQKLSNIVVRPKLNIDLPNTHPVRKFIKLQRCMRAVWMQFINSSNSPLKPKLACKHLLEEAHEHIRSSVRHGGYCNLNTNNWLVNTSEAMSYMAPSLWEPRWQLGCLYLWWYWMQ